MLAKLRTFNSAKANAITMRNTGATHSCIEQIEDD